MMKQIQRPTHRPELFQQYIQYDGPEGEGFKISRSEDNQEIFILDDYGGWVDRELNYYNQDGDAAGYFDPDFNFYDMQSQRIPGGYRGGKTVEKKIREKIKFLDSVAENAKLVIDILNLPKATTPSQIIQYILDRCNIPQMAIEECKKVQKDPSKGYVVVSSVEIAKKLLLLEGRRFRIRDSNKYICNEIQLFVRESKFNRPPPQQTNNQPPPIIQESNNSLSIAFEMDPNKSLEDLQKWLCVAAVCTAEDFTLSKGVILASNEDVMYRILKQNGRTFGESRISLKQK